MNEPIERTAFRCTLVGLWWVFALATSGTAATYVLAVLASNPSLAITTLVLMVPDAMLLGGAIFMTERAALLDGRHAGSVVVLQQRS